MNTEEFAKAMEEIAATIVVANASGSADDIANVYIKAAMEGLVISEIIVGEPFPQPLCRMIFLTDGVSKIPTNRLIQTVNSYIYPADQVK